MTQKQQQSAQQQSAQQPNNNRWGGTLTLKGVVPHKPQKK